MPLAGASVILQRSSPGFWLGALKVSVVVYHLWYYLVPTIPYAYIKCTHKGEFMCPFSCFGSQQSGEFRLNFLIEIARRILFWSPSANFNVMFLTLLSEPNIYYDKWWL